MGLQRIFLVSFYWLVGVSIVILINPCDDTFLSNNGRGPIPSEYFPTAAATCVFWSDNTWYILNTFVGFNTTQRCPALNQCNSSIKLIWLWMNGTLPVSNGSVFKEFCETGVTGCCENKTMIKVSDCLPFRVYFHRNSTGCNEAYCFVNGPDVNHTLGKNISSAVSTIKVEIGTSQISQIGTSQISQIGTSQISYTSSVNRPIVNFSPGNINGAPIQVWSICLIAILIAAIAYLILVTVAFKMRKERQRVDAVNDKLENLMQPSIIRIAK